MSVQIDKLGTIEIVEMAGRIQEVRRKATVKDLPSSEVQTVLAALLGDPYLPVVGDELIVGGQRVRLEQRLGRILPDGDGEVELLYRRQDTAETVVPRVEFGTLEITTERDAEGTQITVEHNGVTQGGEVTYRWVYPILLYDFVVQQSVIGNYLAGILGRVNETAWQGGEPGTWQCCGGGAELVNGTLPTPMWRVRLQMEYRFDTHQPQVVFIDPETGRPPAGLVEDEGYKVVTILPEAEFADFVGG